LAAEAPVGRDGRAFWHGTLHWLVLSAGVVLTATGLQWALYQLPVWLAAVGLGLCLKPLLAWRMLRTEVLAVEAALGQSLAAGRERLGWLVSRDVASLSEAQVRESAIESLAENLSDSVVAPLFWFVLAGLPGAALYRFANTADAMWGYRTVRGGRQWEWAGKWAARADDVLNWLPARLTGCVLALWAGGRVLRALPAQAGLTPSPNSGWPMAAMALALGVRLGKPGVYTLNAAGHQPVASDVGQAIDFCRKVLLVLVCVALAVVAVVCVAT
jgi:adenosylcobinamide-phosphate synthase